MKLEQTIRRHVERLPLALQGEVLDYVVYLQQKAPRHSVDDPQRRMKLSGTLERLVALNPFADTDPVAWSTPRAFNNATNSLKSLDNIGMGFQPRQS